MNKMKFADFFMKTAFLLAQKSHCVSHRVGSVIVRDNRIISVGYNGSAPGCTNCDHVFDVDHFDRDAHRNWSSANEIHAEMNALMFAAKHDIGVDECDMYSTLSPCNDCLKNIAMSGIKNVYYMEKYDSSDFNAELLKKVNVEEFVIAFGTQLGTEMYDFLTNNLLIWRGKGVQTPKTSWNGGLWPTYVFSSGKFFKINESSDNIRCAVYEDHDCEIFCDNVNDPAGKLKITNVTADSDEIDRWTKNYQIVHAIPITKDQYEKRII